MNEGCQRGRGHSLINSVGRKEESAVDTQHWKTFRILARGQLSFKRNLVFLCQFLEFLVVLQELQKQFQTATINHMKGAANGEKRDTGRAQQCWLKTTGGSVLSQFNGCILRPIRSHLSQFETSTSHWIISILQRVLNCERPLSHLLATWWQRDTPPRCSQRFSKHWVLLWIVVKGAGMGECDVKARKTRTHTKDTLAPGREAAARWI